jgi:hypothetical protein
MTAGGAAGKVTIDHVPAGDALGVQNDQRYAFQFGVTGNAGTPPFVVRTRLSSPFFDGGAPAAAQSEGLFIGAGADDDYLKIVATGSAGQPAIEVVHEISGVAVSNLVSVPGLLAGAGVDLQLVIDPAAATVQPRYGVTGGSLVNAGPAIALAPGSRLHDAVTGAPALAVGIIATSRGASPFAATWEFIEVAPIASVGVGEGPAAGSLRLLPVRPNPSSGPVAFGLELPRGARVRLQLYDLQGARVRNVADRDFRPGVHSIRWDGRDELGARVANGVYFARIEVGDQAFTQRVVVLK